MKIKSFLFTAAMLVSMTASAQIFSVEGTLSGEKGETIQLPLSLNNCGMSIIAFQLDITLPEGVAFETDEYGDVDVTLTNRKADHGITCEQQEGGAMRFVSYSNKNREYKGTEGEIFTVPIRLDAEVGEYVINITNASVVNLDSEETACPDVTVTLTIKENLATGINSVNAGAGTNEIYNLQGQRINNATSKGLYIVNGKKTIVK